MGTKLHQYRRKARIDTALRHAYYCIVLTSTQFGTVTRRPHPTSFGLPTSISRALAHLLLLFVLYGTTIEATHRHGQILETSISDQSASIAQTPGSTNARLGQLGCSECSLCRLQKNFSAALISVRTDSGTLSANLKLFSPAFLNFKSQTNAPRSGRAPPFTS